MILGDLFDGFLELIISVVSIELTELIPHGLRCICMDVFQLAVTDYALLFFLHLLLVFGQEKHQVSLIEIRECRLGRNTPEIHLLVCIETVHFQHLRICDIRYGSHVYLT